MNIEQPFHSVTASPEKYDLFILERIYAFCLNEERDEHRPLFPRPSRKGNENKFEHACFSHYYSKYLYVCPTLKYQSLPVVLFASLSQSNITHVVCSRQTTGPVHIRDLIVTGLRTRVLSGLHRGRCCSMYVSSSMRGRGGRREARTQIHSLSCEVNTSQNAGNAS